MDPRKPVIPIGVEHDESHVVVHRDGTIREASMVILSEHDVGRVRAGYVCAVCLEAQEQAFPDKCKVCGFRMSDRQAEYVAQAYQGTIKAGPSSSLEDELAALKELEDKQRREADISAPQVLIPRMW